MNNQTGMRVFGRVLQLTGLIGLVGALHLDGSWLVWIVIIVSNVLFIEGAYMEFSNEVENHV